MPIARKYKAVASKPVRQNLSRLILEKIAEGGEILLNSFFPAKYPQARLWRNLLGLDPTYEFKRPTFNAVLYQLKAQGLIKQTTKQNRNYWQLTKRGVAMLDKQKSETPLLKDGQKRLVCFDIPEYDRAKRQWLRGELLAFGYQQLQKSVWIGESPLPQEFVDALDALELRGHVHIMRVEKEGTLIDKK